MHVGAGFEQGDVRAGSEQTTLYEIVGSVTIAAEQNREDSELWDRCQHALVSRRLCSHSRSVPAPGHPCGLWRNSAGVGKNVAGFVRTVLGLPKRFADGRAARSPRSDSGASVQGVVCSMRAKYSSSSFSACARVAIGAPQFTDAIASSTAMKARAILAAYWVKAIGVARLDEFRD